MKVKIRSRTRIGCVGKFEASRSNRSPRRAPNENPEGAFCSKYQFVPLEPEKATGRERARIANGVLPSGQAALSSLLDSGSNRLTNGGAEGDRIRLRLWLRRDKPSTPSSQILIDEKWKF